MADVSPVEIYNYWMFGARKMERSPESRKSGEKQGD